MVEKVVGFVKKYKFAKKLLEFVKKVLDLVKFKKKKLLTFKHRPK